MSTADRERWNVRYRASLAAPLPEVPQGLVEAVELIPTRGTALDVACGMGGGALWLAERGLDVEGLDASDVAITRARRAAEELRLDRRCRFRVHDLDAGLPPGRAVDLIVCHLFSAPGLDGELIGRLKPGGTLAITVLSEVGGEPGLFQVGPGQLIERFSDLEVRHHREGNGRATLVGVATGPTAPNAA